MCGQNLLKQRRPGAGKSEDKNRIWGLTARFPREDLGRAGSDLFVALLGRALGTVLQLRFFDRVAFGVVRKGLRVVFAVFVGFAERKLQIDAILAAEVRIIF